MKTKHTECTFVLLETNKVICYSEEWNEIYNDLFYFYIEEGVSFTQKSIWYFESNTLASIYDFHTSFIGNLYAHSKR